MLRNLAFITAPLTALVLLSGCNNVGTPAATNAFAGNWNADITLESLGGTNTRLQQIPLTVASDGKITSPASTDTGTFQGTIQNDGATNLSISGVVDTGAVIGGRISGIFTGKLVLSGASASGRLSATLTSNASPNPVIVPANVTLTRG